MDMKKTWLFFVGWLLALAPVAAQNYGTGCLFDPARYESVPLTAPLVRGYDNLPRSASLKKYCPLPQDQDKTGTCTAWATAYAGRTILMAQRRGLTSPSLVTPFAFSPSYVYNQIRLSPDCQQGTYIIDAMHTLKTRGTTPFNQFGFECTRAVTANDHLRARDNTILDYKRLFLYHGNTVKSAVLSPVKKSLAENKPVIISIKCFGSWDRAKGVWNPPTNLNDVDKGYHAVAVVGYDDNLYGGAVEIMNSWGPKWCNSGFMWMRYADFEKYCVEAFEMSDHAAALPPSGVNPKPTDSSPVGSFGGEVVLKKSDGRTIETALAGQVYRTRQAQVAGTMFQFFLSHQQPVYVYAFGLDQQNRCTLLFPRPGTSALLSYRQGTVAYPSEKEYVQLDNSRGSEYLVMFYSRRELDIRELMAKVEAASGGATDRVGAALGNLAIPAGAIQYKAGLPGFTLRGGSYSGSVVPVVVEMLR
jgi:hypothetical protein